MIPFPHLLLVPSPFLGDGEKRGRHCGTGNYDVVPVQISQREFGEEVEVFLELLEGSDNSRCTIGLSILGLERHDVFGFLKPGLCVQMADPDLERGLVAIVDGDEVGESIFGNSMGWLLGIDLAKGVLVGFEWFEKGGHRLIAMLRDVGNEVPHRRLGR